MCFKLGIESVKDGLIAAAPFITLVVLWATIRMTRALKRTDLLVSFGQRFNELMTMRHELNKRVTELMNLAGNAKGLASVSLEADALNYYKRHFDLQFNEFYAFRKGLLEREIFTLWMRSCALQYERDKIGDTKYEQGWKSWLDEWHLGMEDEFTKFMSKVHDCKGDAQRVRKI